MRVPAKELRGVADLSGEQEDPAAFAIRPVGQTAKMGVESKGRERPGELAAQSGCGVPDTAILVWVPACGQPVPAP